MNNPNSERPDWLDEDPKDPDPITRSTQHDMAVPLWLRRGTTLHDLLCNPLTAEEQQTVATHSQLPTQWQQDFFLSLRSRDTRVIDMMLSNPLALGYAAEELIEWATDEPGWQALKQNRNDQLAQKIAFTILSRSEALSAAGSPRPMEEASVQLVGEIMTQLADMIAKKDPNLANDYMLSIRFLFGHIASPEFSLPPPVSPLIQDVPAPAEAAVASHPDTDMPDWLNQAYHVQSVTPPDPQQVVDMIKRVATDAQSSDAPPDWLKKAVEQQLPRTTEWYDALVQAAASPESQLTIIQQDKKIYEYFQQLSNTGYAHVARCLNELGKSPLEPDADLTGIPTTSIPNAVREIRENPHTLGVIVADLLTWIKANGPLEGKFRTDAAKVVASLVLEAGIEDFYRGFYISPDDLKNQIKSDIAIGKGRQSLAQVAEEGFEHFVHSDLSAIINELIPFVKSTNQPKWAPDVRAGIVARIILLRRAMVKPDSEKKNGNGKSDLRWTDI